jgi:hypothetical protein
MKLWDLDVQFRYLPEGEAHPIQVCALAALPQNQKP